MLSFIQHKKFWLPLVLIAALALLTEAMLRAGWYDRWLKPMSFISDAVIRLQAIESKGLDQIDWITVGDSRMDWGVDHRQLRDQQRLLGIEHVRMSFGGSRFPAIQATIDWSIQNMPNLEGVMLGITESDLAHYVSLEKQVKVAWPFKSHFDFEQYQPLNPSHPDIPVWSQWAWFHYFSDVQSLLKNPIKRLKELERQEASDPPLLYKKDVRGNDLCAHPLNTLQQCVASTEVINHNARGNEGFRVVQKICGTQAARNRAKTNEPMPDRGKPLTLINNWTALIENTIRKRKQFTLVLLPEHESHKYIIKPANAGLITERILNKLQKHRQFKLIDFRELFAQESDCEMYADPSHYSDAGIDKITAALLAELSVNNATDADQ